MTKADERASDAQDAYTRNRYKTGHSSYPHPTMLDETPLVLSDPPGLGPDQVSPLHNSPAPTLPQVMSPEDETRLNSAARAFWNTSRRWGCRSPTERS